MPMKLILTPQLGSSDREKELELGVLRMRTPDTADFPIYFPRAYYLTIL